MRLKDKSIVITGASSGMGRDIVRLFVKEGANVLAVARRENRLLELKEELKEEAGKIEIFVGDVSKRETNESMIDKAIELYGKLDVLVNNAGIVDDMSPITEATDEMYERIMAVNVYGPMCAMRKAVKVFTEQGNGGSIVNVASMGAKRPIAGPIYCASKGAITTLSQNVAFMHAQENIRCNVIAPAAFATEISSNVKFHPEGGARIRKNHASCTGIGKGMDAAYAALYFASDDSSFISGTFLPIDKAWLAGG